MSLHEPAAGANAAADRRARVRIGLALLLLSALSFSLHNTLARLAYDEGVTPTTIAAVRTWAVLLFFVIAFGSKGQWPRVPRAVWPAFAITAVCYSLHNPLLLIAFEFVPVGLAILVLYVFPLLVAFMAAAIGQERLRAGTLAAAAVAFGGVALVLETGGAAFDWRGLALAGVSALALAGNIVGAAQLNRHMTALAVPYALSTLGAIVFGALTLADGGPVFPDSIRGWTIFTVAILTSPGALIAFYLALPRAGAPRSAVMMNTEPVLTMALAAWLLGETLSVLQGAGAALVVGAVAVAALVRMGGRRA